MRRARVRPSTWAFTTRERVVIWSARVRALPAVVGCRAEREGGRRRRIVARARGARRDGRRARYIRPEGACHDGPRRGFTVIITNPPRAPPRTPSFAGSGRHVTTGKSEDLPLVRARRAPAAPPARAPVVSNEGAAVVRRHAENAATGEPARDHFCGGGVGEPSAKPPRSPSVGGECGAVSAKPADHVAPVFARPTLRKCET
jgi:hypothetical protein